MSQPQAGTPSTAPAPSGLGVALVRGKITSMRRSVSREGGVLTVLTMPAADEFSYPAVIEVQSAEALGEVGLMWSGKVRIDGMPKRFRVDREDPATGEIRAVQVNAAQNFLHVIS